MKYIESFFGNMLDSTGRTSRKDFWMTILALVVFNFAIGTLVAFLGTFFKAPKLLNFTMTAFGVASLLSTISMQIRRLHDSNKPSYFIFFNFIPVVGQIIVFAFYLMPGDREANHFGYPTRL